VNDLEADKQNILKAISILKEKCRVGKGESHP
jgi:hypothetical protein